MKDRFLKISPKVGIILALVIVGSLSFFHFALAIKKSPIFIGPPVKPKSLNFYVYPYSNATNQADQWRTTRPVDAFYMDKIAKGAQARWFGNWNSDIYSDVRNYVNLAAASSSIPVLVAYNIPERDCGSFSGGGSDSITAYQNWIKAFSSSIGNNSAWVILEPDALPQITCLSPEDQVIRNDLLNSAISALKANPNTRVYVDIGHPHWLSVDDAVSRLKNAGIDKADGFSLNVSNFVSTSENIFYGQKISSLIGNKHFVIDTSRNGFGDNGEWCNPSGRALGNRPTSLTNADLVDAYLWIKNPGESDGNCNGGPNAGMWWPDYALGLAQRATW